MSINIDDEGRQCQSQPCHPVHSIPLGDKHEVRVKVWEQMASTLLLSSLSNWQDGQRNRLPKCSKFTENRRVFCRVKHDKTVSVLLEAGFQIAVKLDIISCVTCHVKFSAF